MRLLTCAEAAAGREAGNGAMTPGATRLRVTFEPRGDMTRVALTHLGLVSPEAARHATGWPRFTAGLVVAAEGGDPRPDPWKGAPPS